jgi:CRISPR-associated protein Cmr4
MFREATPLFLICETPLHAGSGNELGVVDLPIQRERHTSFPKIESSSLKGSLREAFENKLTDNEDRKRIHLAFGFDERTTNEDDTVKNYFGVDKQFQGALGFTDARLLLFPVKSMKGVFAWITCERVLEQFKKDLALTDCNFEIVTPEANTVSYECELLLRGEHVVLEEYSFKMIKDANYEGNTTKLALWLANRLFDSGTYWHNHLMKNLVILANDDYTDFVNLSTEVLTRIKIDNEKGTVQDGALFTEEYLPAESVLYSLALFSPLFHADSIIAPFVVVEENEKRDWKKEVNAVRGFFRQMPRVVQIGGNATLGKGLVRTMWECPAAMAMEALASNGGVEQ